MNKGVCIVTGGANGIGRCITESLIREGAFVVIIDTDAVSGENLVAKYGTNRISFFCGDIADRQVLDDFTGFLAANFSRVSVLVNNACITRGGLENCSYDDFTYVLRVGVAAPFYLTQKLAPIFAPGASVVNISSTRAFMSQSNTESYTAAKGGISALTHAMSITLTGKARVNSISPGWIDTGAYQHDDSYTPQYSESDKSQHPVGRVGTPDDIAQMVLFLCSDKAGFITGENITIDGGMTKLMIYHDDRGWTYNGPEPQER